jgi:hypothetical protein
MITKCRCCDDFVVIVIVIVIVEQGFRVKLGIGEDGRGLSILELREYISEVQL